MAGQARSERRRQRARRARRSRTLAPSPLDLPRAALGTTERLPISGERFLAEHPEMERPFPSSYNPSAWPDPAHSTLAQGALRGWPRRGMIALMLFMLLGALVGVAQMAGALGARNGTWGQNLLFGLLICGLSGIQAFACARALPRPAARR